MVLLTMTPAIVHGLARLDLQPDSDWTCSTSHDAHLLLDGEMRQADDTMDPPLQQPAVGKPISHRQILHLWRRLQSVQPAVDSLETLLQGSRLYLPPPLPRAEPSDEYKALMARLRRKEAERAYERMTKPQPGLPPGARQFAEANRPTWDTDLGDDDVTYSEVHRQLMLLINFLASILGVAATLWVAARWWSLPARLLLTMSGAMLVAVAEVAVYQGYVWRMAKAKESQKNAKEVREVVETWVLSHGDGDGDGQAPRPDSSLPVKSKTDDRGGPLRKRTVKPRPGLPVAE